MKTIENNSENTLDFVNNNISLADASSVRLRQLGGSGFTVIPITDIVSDCFVNSITFNVVQDSLYNGTYILEVLDSVGVVLDTATILVKGFDDDNPRAYIVSDDTVTADQYVLLKPNETITWSHNGLTFSG